MPRMLCMLRMLRLPGMLCMLRMLYVPGMLNVPRMLRMLYVPGMLCEPRVLCVPCRLCMPRMLCLPVMLCMLCVPCMVCVSRVQCSPCMLCVLCMLMLHRPLLWHVHTPGHTGPVFRDFFSASPVETTFASRFLTFSSKPAPGYAVIAAAWTTSLTLWRPAILGRTSMRLKDTLSSMTVALSHAMSPGPRFRVNPEMVVSAAAAPLEHAACW